MSSENKGRILRLKQGYNPNSSSIGTIVFAMPAALMASTAAFAAAAAFISTALSSTGRDRPLRHGRPKGEGEAAPEREGDEPRD